MSQTRVCSLCEAMCGILVKTNEQGEVESIKANPQDVFSQGAYCPKARGLKDLYEDPDRLRTPLKRVNGRFEEISWTQAFDEIATKIKRLQGQYGKSSLAIYAGNPNVHNFGNILLLPMFLRSLGTKNRFSATSVDQLPHMLVAILMFGHQLLLPIADVDHTDFMIIMGANPAVSNGSLLSAAGLSSRLRRICKRGGQVVVLDPRYTETAALASKHHFIRPGTDVYFLAAFLHLMLADAERFVRTDAISEHLKGLETLTNWFQEVDPSACAAACGIELPLIEALLEDFSAAKSGLVYGRMGLSTQPWGTLCQWMINLINILSGNFDRRGGVLFTKPAVDIVAYGAKMGSRGSFARRHSRVRKLPEFGGEFPVGTLADEMLEPGDGQVKGLITIAGNPVLSTPNGKKLEKAISGLDLYVAIDFYQTETTGLADYILPPSSPLEHSHYDLIFNALATRNTARYSPAVVPKQVGAKEDWQIMLELWRRLTPDSKLLSKLQRRVIASLVKGIGIDRILDLMLRIGPYGKSGLSLKRLKKHKNGIDFGALSASVPDRLFTKDKKIDLVPERLQQTWRDFIKSQAAEPDLASDATYVLIGRRNLRSNNSWMHNCQSLNKEKNPFYLLMNPQDASQQGFRDGQRVKLQGAAGTIEIPLKLTDKIMPGVVSAPHGWGHSQSAANRLQWAKRHETASINDVIDDKQLEALTGNAILNGQRVNVLAP